MMRIAQMYSHLNGYEYLLVHKKALWDEVCDVIGSIDAEACRVKISKEKGMEGSKLFAPIEMNKAFREKFVTYKWQEERTSYWVTEDASLIRKTMTMPQNEQKHEIESAGKTPLLSYNQTDFVKDRVAVEVQFGKYAFVAYDLFVKHMAFFIGDKIDVGIEILPMKSLQSKMSSGVGYYEGELYNLVRQGRGVPAVPLVLVGIEP